MELEILNTEGKSTGKKVKLPAEIFSIEPNDHAIYLDVKRILAGRRSGNHKAKERAEITGSTKKLRRQKGTGYARVGSIKSPIFRGGGRAFGPRVRDYDIKVNKKVRSLARKSALSYKAKDKAIIVLQNVTFEQPKTREFVALLSNLNVNDKKVLYISKDIDENTSLSMRNLPNVLEVIVDALNTYDISNANSLVFTEDAFKRLTELNWN